MRMIEIDLFSIKSLNAESKVEEIVSSVSFNRKKTNLILKGEKFDYQLQVENFYLLITSTLVSLSEIVYFYLLDDNLEIIDDLLLSGNIWGSFFLENLEVVSERTIEFSYTNDEDKWRLSILPQRNFKFPRLNLYSIVIESNLMTHFKLRQIKK